LSQNKHLKNVTGIELNACNGALRLSFYNKFIKKGKGHERHTKSGQMVDVRILYI
jgi:hypothetical protein